MRQVIDMIKNAFLEKTSPNSHLDDYERRLNLFTIANSFDTLLISVIGVAICLYSGYSHSAIAYISMVLIVFFNNCLFFTNLINAKTSIALTSSAAIFTLLYILINTGGTTIQLLWFATIPFVSIIVENRKLATIQIIAGLAIMAYALKYTHTFNDETINTCSYWLFQYFQLISIGFITYTTLSYDKKLQNNLNNNIRSRNTLFSSQKALINQQQEDIHNSISYGKKIQNGLLSNEIQLRDKLPNSYIFNRKQGDLSGGIFWTKKVNDRILCAIGSSKLEAIPGAFLSVFGITLLNQYSILKKPSSILNAIHSQALKNISQLDEKKNNNDGIDLGLISIDLERKKLEFSGANRSLWVSRVDTIFEIEGNKTPIACANTKESDFKNHEIDLQKGDIIYLFTNGYISSKDSKLKVNYTSFEVKQLFTHLQSLPFSKHKQFLNPVFEKWKKEEKIESVDLLLLSIQI